MRETPILGTAWQPQPPAPPQDQNDITQPIRIISSRNTRTGGARNSRVTWFKKYEEDGVRRTPDFTEIGDPTT